jgi:hypothetical protein
METLIQDESYKHKYYSEIPHLIDDLPISGSAHRLYCHYKRRTGDDPEGACWESTENTAKLLQLSKSTICKVRQELERWSLVNVKKINRGGGKYPYCLVTIMDIWKANALIYGTWSKEKRTEYFERARKLGVDEVTRMNHEGGY